LTHLFIPKQAELLVMATRSQCCHFKFMRALLSSELAPFSCTVQQYVLDARVIF